MAGKNDPDVEAALVHISNEHSFIQWPESRWGGGYDMCSKCGRFRCSMPSGEKCGESRIFQRALDLYKKVKNAQKRP